MSSIKDDYVTKELQNDSKDLQDQSQDISFPGWKKAVPITVAILVSFFLVALDRTIIGTAIPQITNDFNSLGDIGWYGSAYMFTTCAFQLSMGRIYTFYSPKKVFLGNVVLFEIGSIICGAAPNSTAFIWGRAIAGLGAAGIFSGAVTITLYIIPLKNQPLFVALMGSMFGIASIIAPLVGGAFTERVSWRWCFYINLPVGAITMVLIIWLLQLPPREEQKVPIKDQIQKLDPLGTVVFIPGIVCLLLALQWGGSTYRWNSSRIIALLVLAAILLISFIVIQIWKQENATVPPRIAKQRTVAFANLFSLCIGSVLIVAVYYLPLWFQAIKGANAEKSGIMNLPLVLSLVVASFFGGGLIRKIGYYTPFLIATTCFTSIASGLLTTFETNTGHAKWIGYQFILGFGLGLGMQQTSTAIRVVLPDKDVPIGTSLIFFSQSLGGTIFMSVAQNVFTSSLVEDLSKIPVLKLDPRTIVGTGATALREGLSPEISARVLNDYNTAVVKTFYVALALALLSLVGALGVEWRSIDEKKESSEETPKDEVESSSAP